MARKPFFSVNPVARILDFCAQLTPRRALTRHYRDPSDPVQAEIIQRAEAKRLRKNAKRAGVKTK